MKNQPFRIRLGFALAGLRTAIASEYSFRFQMLAALAVLMALIIIRPAALWWGIVLMTVSVVLAAELFNTALERLADHLHPDEHPRIKIIKDCAAAAVLLTSLGAVGVAIAFVCSLLG